MSDFEKTPEPKRVDSINECQRKREAANMFMHALQYRRTNVGLIYEALAKECAELETLADEFSDCASSKELAIIKNIDLTLARKQVRSARGKIDECKELVAIRQERYSKTIHENVMHLEGLAG